MAHDDVSLTLRTATLAERFTSAAMASTVLLARPPGRESAHGRTERGDAPPALRIARVDLRKDAVPAVRLVQMAVCLQADEELFGLCQRISDEGHEGQKLCSPESPQSGTSQCATATAPRVFESAPGADDSFT